MSEKPLVAFTLLAQMAAGILAGLAVLQALLVWRFEAHPAGGFLARPLLLAGVLIGLALAASLLHLGSPGNAWRALTNLRSSWLSREILSVLLLLAAWAASSLALVLDLGALALGLLLAAAAACGLALVYSMARLYGLRTIPAWSRTSTLASFLTTTFLLGSLILLFTLALPAKNAVQPSNELANAALPWTGLAALACLCAQFLAIPFSLAGLAFEPDLATAVARNWLGPFRGWLAARLALLAAAGAVILAILAGAARYSGSPATLAWLAAAALFLVLLSETLGRVLFYELRQATRLL